MKVIILLIVVLFPPVIFSQTFQGLDLDESTNWEQHGVLFIKRDVGYFDKVTKYDKDVTFYCYKPTGMIYKEVYEEIKSIFGYSEYRNDDYIPSFIDKDDYSMLATFVKNREAKIFKLWVSFEPERYCTLSWGHDYLSVSFY